ncbi:MAG: uroporphyrinogen decarboxylase family protein [Gammaproteobacteria bacterium]|nr:uroporphyrinogen decarboxylase family protein [Gammaproteobacteria bacterium]
MAISHRERVQKALNHEETDRVPIDFGGGPATQIHPTAYSNLLEYLGFAEENLPTSHRGEGQVVAPSERILRYFDVDVRGFYTLEPDSSQGRPIAENKYIDEWGVTWEKSGTLHPYINVLGPLQHISMPVIADIDSIQWPVPDDPSRIRGLRDRIEHVRTQTDYAVVLNLPNSTFALTQRVRGFVETLEDLLLNKAFIEALHERVTDVICGIATLALDEVGDLIDGVSFGDDMGTQSQSYMGIDLYKELVKPHHVRFVDVLHKHTDAKVIIHSDGSVRELLPDFIDCGIDVINPVQVSATGMEPGQLNREFGKYLSFWGGIDTQHVLPWGDENDVMGAVTGRRKDLGKGGGYVQASVHNIQSEVPPENVVAMFETALGRR